MSHYDGTKSVWNLWRWKFVNYKQMTFLGCRDHLMEKQDYSHNTVSSIFSGNAFKRARWGYLLKDDVLNVLLLADALWLHMRHNPHNEIQLEKEYESQTNTYNVKILGRDINVVKSWQSTAKEVCIQFISNPDVKVNQWKQFWQSIRSWNRKRRKTWQTILVACLVWFLCLMAYQPSWLIEYQIHPCRRTDVVLFKPLLEK